MASNPLLNYYVDMFDVSGSIYIQWRLLMYGCTHTVLAVILAASTLKDDFVCIGGLTIHHPIMCHCFRLRQQDLLEWIQRKPYVCRNVIRYALSYPV